MEHFISWFEIPAINFERAVNFYSSILEIEIEEMDMDGQRMGTFPMDGKNISGAIVEAGVTAPSAGGVLVYLNGGKDLQLVLDRIEKAQGSIQTPKTQISPDFGYFGIFTDTEGNTLGLHSME